MMRYLIMTGVIYGSFFLVELINGWRLKSTGEFLNKFTVCYFSSLVFIILAFALEFLLPEDLFFPYMLNYFFSFAGFFLLTVYILFRGVFVLFKVSGEGENHPTCVTIRKFIQRPRRAYVMISVALLLAYSPHIFALLIYLYLFLRF